MIYCLEISSPYFVSLCIDLSKMFSLVNLDLSENSISDVSQILRILSIVFAYDL